MLDIVMPVMKSMETLGRIIGQHKDVHLILYSSYPHYRKDFMSWAADTYLTKSSDLTELKRVIKNLLDEQHKRKDEVSLTRETQVAHKKCDGSLKGGCGL